MNKIYFKKYLKYKIKYLELKGGANITDITDHDVSTSTAKTPALAAAPVVAVAGSPVIPAIPVIPAAPVVAVAESPVIPVIPVVPAAPDVYTVSPVVPTSTAHSDKTISQIINEIFDNIDISQLIESDILDHIDVNKIKDLNKLNNLDIFIDKYTSDKSSDIKNNLLNIKIKFNFDNINITIEKLKQLKHFLGSTSITESELIKKINAIFYNT
jgi:hypothetical protein